MVKPQFKITRENVFVVAFFLLLAALFSLLFTLLEPFLRSFLWAVIFAMVFYPVYNRLFHWAGKRRTIAALLATLLVILFLALPGFYIFSNLGKDVAKAYILFSNTQWEERSAWVLGKLQAMGFGKFLEHLGMETDQSQQFLQNHLVAALQDLSQYILDKLSFLFKNILYFALEFFFVTVALFFFF